MNRRYLRLSTILIDKFFYSVETVLEEQPSANSWQTMGKNQNENRHTQGQSEKQPNWVKFRVTQQIN